MSAQPTTHLRLAGTPLEGIDGASLRIERRACPRYPAAGAASGIMRIDGRAALFGVALVDSSASGLRIVTDRRTPIGATLKIHFDGQPTPGRQGRVVRCRAFDAGDGLPAYDVAIECVRNGANAA